MPPWQLIIDSTLAQMVKLLVVFCCVFFTLNGSAQKMSDYLSLKKRNGISIENYYPGWPITFTTSSGQYEGPIAKIEHDSVYVTFYQIIKQPTIWGTWIADTVRTDIVPFHYKEIKQIMVVRKYKKRGYLKTLGALMEIGGGGYEVLNIVNTIRNIEPVFSPQNSVNLGIAAAVFGTGFFLNKKFNQYNRISKKYKIVYVNMQ